jgi:hypothetical protein
MDPIYGAELWMLTTEDPEGGNTQGLLLIATPTGKHWHVMPLKDYDNTDHLQAMALHYISTLGLDEMTVIECTTTEKYLMARDDSQDHDEDEDD